MLNAVAGSLTTTPLTSESPVPPNVSMPRCTVICHRLTDLNSHGSIGVGDDALELRHVDRPCVDVETARPLAKRSFIPTR